ncbi:2-dehydropantoate 2-reductase [uncultured Comamonas sp.]|uniref:ketopantoate reductase family protein n=1 Tax=uncultured Comamonas sp. TaxID=114710 RepID=UPI0025E33EE4|nr:2-dehydropantoate 2-reductase [uncultured Comamonas sp.]
MHHAQEPQAATVGILGAGAMGTLFGTRLAQAGIPVTLVDINPELLEAIREHGVHCETDQGPLRARVQALQARELRQPPARWLIFTKAAHTQAALQSIAHVIGPETLLLSLQNGMGHIETLHGFADARQIAVGVTTWPARLLEAGRVSSLGSGKIRFMPRNGLVDARFQDFCNDLNRAGLHCEIDPEVETAIWEKLAFNAAFNGLCGVTRQTVDALATPLGRELIRDVLDEVVSVAAACGIAIDVPRLQATVEDALNHHVGHQPSLLQDLLAGRPTETDSIHGSVVRAAERHGIATPVTRTLHRLISVTQQRTP